MGADIDHLKERLKRWTLLLGVLQIMVGCVVGLVPPAAVAWFRGLVMAHIEFTANGVLMVVFAFLIKELRLNPRGLKIWFAALQTGTWTNGAAGLMAAITGASSKLMPTINEKFPPPGGVNSALVSATLQLCGISIILALGLTVFGLVRSGAGSNDVNA